LKRPREPFDEPNHEPFQEPFEELFEEPFEASIGRGGRGIPSRGGFAAEVEAELEVGLEPELEAEASSCLGFFVALRAGFSTPFLGSSCFASAGQTGLTQC